MLLLLIDGLYLELFIVVIGLSCLDCAVIVMKYQFLPTGSNV